MLAKKKMFLACFVLLVQLQKIVVNSEIGDINPFLYNFYVHENLHSG